MTGRFGITLSHGHSPVGVELGDLVGLALRRNPRRAQLLVSTVLGKHLPADPRVVAGAGRLLGALVAAELREESDSMTASWASSAADALAGLGADEFLAALDQDLGSSPTIGLVVGFAETATALGHLVADQLQACYLHSTRRDDGTVPVAARFTEPHSHAVAHLLRPEVPAQLTGREPLVLVDDELSTGRTALNVIEAIHTLAPRDRYVIAGLVDVRSAASDRNRADVADRLGCRIDVVSLVRGEISVPPGAVVQVAAAFAPTDGAAVDGDGATADCGRAAPRGEVAGSGGGKAAVAGPSRIRLAWPLEVPTGGRHGFDAGDRLAFDRAVGVAAAAVSRAAEGARRMLVVGTEEFMYLPLRIALDLARRPGAVAGRSVAFQSTTRSPVHPVDRPGYPIRRRIEFTGGMVGGPAASRFLYNAAWPERTAVEPLEGTAVEPLDSAAATPDGARLSEADLIVIIDDGPAQAGPDGLAASVMSVTGVPVLVATLTPRPVR